MKNIEKYSISALLALLILFSPLSVSKNNLTEKQQAVIAKVKEIAKKNNIPSLSIAVGNLNTSTTNNHFYFNYHHPDLLQQNIYGIGSTTKLLSAVLVMHFVEQQKINVNDKVIKYVDKSQLKDINNIDDVTVLQLLRHESGISDYANNPDWFKSITENKAPASFQEKMALVNSKRTTLSNFSYSNTNYLILEKVIEKVTNLSFKEAFNNYYKSLQLNITMGSTEENLQAFFAQTNKNSNNVSALKEHYGFDGGAYTNANNLLKLFSMLFIDKTILSNKSLLFMQNWLPMSPKEIPIGKGKINSYGLGMMNLLHQKNSYIGHMGGTIKYQSFAFVNVKENTIIIMLTNSSGQHYNNTFFQELVPTIISYNE